MELLAHYGGHNHITSTDTHQLLHSTATQIPEQSNLTSGPGPRAAETAQVFEHGTKYSTW